MSFITPAQWQQYDRDGFLFLGKLINDDELTALQRRIDEIMLGKARLNYDRMLMQLDSESGKYEDAGPQTKGHKGETLNYRKIQDLEYDPVFLAFMQRPVFRDICTHVYGAGTPIACMRAMFFNKPSHRGTKLPWHQDRWTNFDRDPLVTIWSALDPATRQNGCVELIPGSHRRVINPSHGSGFLTPEQMVEHCQQEKAVYLELKAGEVALLHNWTLHSSDVNRSETSRRAFSICYMDANTKAKGGEKYPVIFGDGALRPEELGIAASTV
ncbi:MAG: phytanoyl-CoA dioxygenase family protein [Planctomycetes bacterium]|nr:phytanoyl-CoA dioxygenase family protein [Planctomycetota bacterium]